MIDNFSGINEGLMRTRPSLCCTVSIMVQFTITIYKEAQAQLHQAQVALVMPDKRWRFDNLKEPFHWYLEIRTAQYA